MSAPPSAARLAVLASVRPAPEGVGPDPERPCDQCTERESRCSSPCAALAVLTSPEEIEAPMELSSPALMAGRGYSEPFMVQAKALQLGEDPPDESAEDAMDALRQLYPVERIMEAANKDLSDAQRSVIRAMLEGHTGAEIGKTRGTSRQATHKVKRAAVSALRRALLMTTTNVFRVMGMEDEIKRLNALVAQGGTSPTSVLTIAPGKTIERMSVGPELAERWLSTKLDNRKVSDALVDQYARAMLAGRWEFSPNPISLDEFGRLSDGEHRCWAIYKSKVTLHNVLVTRGLTEAERRCVDSGKSRSVGDSLRIAGVRDGNRLATLVRCIFFLRTRTPTSVSLPDVQAMAERYGKSALWACRSVPKGKLFRAPIAAALMVAHRCDPTSTEAFLAALKSGASLDPGHPALLLRSAVLERPKGTKETERRGMARALKALLLFAEGRTVDRLGDIEQGAEHFMAKLNELDGVIEPSTATTKTRKPRAKKATSEASSP